MNARNAVYEYFRFVSEHGYQDGGTVGSGARSFAEDDPWLTAVLDAWHMSDQSLGTLMSEIEFRGDPVAGARTWLEENRDQVDEWLAAGERIQP
ncbi:hypothetical protein [Salinicola acroporae]|uniref:hypothetical protein n=1 Tax=Salinicola acroporae TaxID=1541440 RepID=UPI002455D634|nr:hypothetical protein [Salinicola acroporae]